MISCKSSMCTLLAAAWALGAAAQTQAPEPEIPPRQMNVRQGPETVFEQAPAEIFPALVGARATNENGRIGSELVFWGFEQADGRRVFLFACAPRPELDCAARVPGICVSRTTLLETRQAQGRTVQRSCRNVAVANPGDVRPGCDDRLEQVVLEVGLVTCG